MSEELFDVVIYHKTTRIVDSVIGKNMRRWDGTGSGRNTAEYRSETGFERINDQYNVAIVKAGTLKKGDRFND